MCGGDDGRERRSHLSCGTRAGLRPSEKGRARSDTSFFKGGLAAEQQGDSAYQRLAFKEAAGYYQAAQDFFAKVAPPAPMSPRPSGDSQNEIRAVLDAYKRAIETKDVDLFRQVRPNLSDAALGRVRASFAQSEYQAVELRVETIEVSGDEARAQGRRLDVFVPKEGRTVHNEAPFVFTLKRGPSGWTIVAVN